MVEIVGKLKPNYFDNAAEWEGSPFQWVKGGITPGQKGKVGEDIVEKFLTHQGFCVLPCEGKGADRIVNGKKVEIKLSTLWEATPHNQAGSYRFQQIRNQDYDILLCLGISPHAAHAWVVCKSQINEGDLSTESKTEGSWGQFGPQHGGQGGGGNTWWLTLSNPPSAPFWLRPQGGDLAEMCKILRKMTSDGGG